MTHLVAHASGTTWDEIILILIPILIVAGFLIVSEVRSRRESAGDGDGEVGE
jgi:hypothetical protein